MVSPTSPIVVYRSTVRYCYACRRAILPQTGARRLLRQAHIIEIISASAAIWLANPLPPSRRIAGSGGAPRPQSLATPRVRHTHQLADPCAHPDGDHLGQSGLNDGRFHRASFTKHILTHDTPYDNQHTECRQTWLHPKGSPGTSADAGTDGSHGRRDAPGLARSANPPGGTCLGSGRLTPGGQDDRA